MKDCADASKHAKRTIKVIDDIVVGLNNIATKYGYGKGTEPFTDDEWDTVFRAKETIKHLAAENQRLREEAAEQGSIADHEHATQMEWFRIACDYKTENAELKKRLDEIWGALVYDRDSLERSRNFKRKNDCGKDE